VDETKTVVVEKMMTMDAKTPQDFETVIGLEVHLQFDTQTKIFCGCANQFGCEPNTNVCPVCLGLPGSLPVLNKTVLQYAVKVALALGCQISPWSKFDRKNYFYPDLPKGYQISQYDFPVARAGQVMIETPTGQKKIGVHRAHLEEDAGKLIHDPALRASLVDYNRAGTPLLEIVTEPDMRSPQEAYDYLTNLKLILQYLDVSDCDMEKGSLRCDANISIRPTGELKLGTKTEIKNLNSFRAVKLALEYEEARQQSVILSGKTIVQETRLWDETKGATVSMRSKEEAHDYRYFPEPDLVPFSVEPADVETIRRSLPELPAAKHARLLTQYGLTDYDAMVLVQERDLADFFEQCHALFPVGKKIGNWINGPLRQELNSRKVAVTALGLTPAALVELIRMVEEGTVSNLVAKDVLTEMLSSGQSASAIVAAKGLAQMSDDTELIKFVDAVIEKNQNVVQQIKGGKENAMGFLVGQIMRQTGGKANPQKVSELIKRRIVNA
jgi:aspartyl-tRNA(Asn)/glutamyl-tRNA(Gln) amidotransferase subunit B